MATNLSICVVDDSADYRFIIQQVFKHYFPTYTVNFYASGQALLDGLADTNLKPGLILLDYHMPDLDGYQTLVRLNMPETIDQIPVVMMSADASQEEMQACHRAGAQSFLLKQTDFDALKADIAVLCHDWFDSLS